jgi:hypothetical protein
MVAGRRLKCVRNHCKSARLGYSSVRRALLTRKASRLCGRGRKTGNGDECHVHAASSCGAGCWSGSRFVRYGRLDRPCGVHAYKGVLGRRAASIFSSGSAISTSWILEGYAGCRGLVEPRSVGVVSWLPQRMTRELRRGRSRGFLESLADGARDRVGAFARHLLSERCELLELFAQHLELFPGVRRPQLDHLGW